MEKPDALRLAEWIEADMSCDGDAAIAAELRRLHGIEFALRDCEKTLEGMAKKYMDAVDQRDALLEALKSISEQKQCADICDQHASVQGIAQRCAEQIRGRGKE